MTRAIDSLQASFASEMKAKDSVLTTAQAQLLKSTRDLATERKQVQELESRMWELDQVGQRIKNLQQALEEEGQVNWTGRTDTPSAPAVAGPSFKFVPRSTDVPPPSFVGPDPAVDPSRSGDARQALIEMRRIKLWQARAQTVFEQRISRVEATSAEKEALYRKVIAMCSGVPAELVEEVSGLLPSSFFATRRLTLAHPLRCSTSSCSPSRATAAASTSAASTDSCRRCVCRELAAGSTLGLRG